MILIYSKGVDDFVNEVIDNLNQDFIRIGDKDTIFINNVSINKKEDNLVIHNEYFKTIDLKSINSIWFNGGFANTNGSSYENSCYIMLIHSYLKHHKAKKVGRLLSDFEVNKLDASLEAQRQGFKVPDTLFTSNKKQLKTFYDKHQTKNGIISKRITDQYIYETDEFQYDFNLTFEIDEKIMNQIPNEFAISLFQEKIKASYEIRVVFMLDSFYAMCVHTFDDDIDYRTKFITQKDMRMTPFNLPKSIEEMLKNVFRNLNLNYGSADLMYQDDNFYFLEINPTGQVSFLNNACNYYLENKLAKHLVNEA